MHIHPLKSFINCVDILKPMYKKRYGVDVIRVISSKKKPERKTQPFGWKIQPSNKKAQVTIFIILGILLLLALILVIFVRTEIVTFKPEELIPTEKGKVERYITTCMDEVGEEALFKIGLQAGYIDVPSEILQDKNLHLRISPMHVIPYWAYGNNVNIPSLEEIKARIDKYLEENVRKCLFDTEAFQEDYDLVEKSGLTANTEIVESKVIFNLHWNIEIRNKGGEVITEVIDHVAESPIKLKKAHDVARTIVEKEMDSLKLEDITQDLISIGHPDVPVAGMEIRCNKKTWDVNKVKQTILELLRINIKELKIKGTDYVEFPEELTYYQNHYTWNVGEEFRYPEISAVFNFDQGYPVTFGVTPLSGNQMRSSQLGGSDILSFLCIQTWKFTYDLVYPVTVRIQDETTGYNFNIAFTVHLIRNLPSRGDVVARPSYFVDSDSSDDYCRDMDIPMTVYTYELVENKESGVYNREPLEGVKTSFTCLKYKCDMGATEYDFAGLGPVAVYRMNFPYCVGGILRGAKDGYKENWVRVVTAPDKEVELDLMPLLSLAADKIKVVKHEFADAENVGPAVKLGKSEVALVKLTKRKADDLPNAPFYEDSVVKSSTVEEEVYQEEKLDFLAKADFNYELEINVLDQEKFVGGYKGNWTVPWEQLENADEIVFHVASRTNAAEERMFDLMLNLQEDSKYVPLPEIK